MTQPVEIITEDFKADLSQAVLNIYINGIHTSRMEQGQFKGDANNKTYTHKTPSFVDYQIVIVESDIFLQMSVYKLGNVTSNCGLITTNKTKTVTFRRIDLSKTRW